MTDPVETGTAPADGAVQSPLRAVLRLEGAAILMLSLLLYHQAGAGWLMFMALFLVPDLSFLGYLAGPRIGAVAYNGAHSLTGPLVLAALARTTGHAEAVPYAVIWAAHVGFDRMLGYGLKYGRGFGYTHLGRIGRAAKM
ncbi:DUF4260 domain-containing protein [Novosphingobium mangrovi (ex Huang et al. 2023)]|uniref:DUF4260 domain-containing protein n=1 Tax=Novosphingobium mangrovi (ex Huang et al. 2023) TaxID=2976432 RepID=A0ABT2I3I6_9SPHN|nr:DUF4260 domain-containing protein [Novosphingobium mangrovi (ex Huang et al. 2023)]MCT2399375.1 DUF4260 domain-containing protein [Novosphingobium mangrovi (ex Huang et al. 2023)]